MTDACPFPAIYFVVCHAARAHRWRCAPCRGSKTGRKKSTSSTGGVSTPVFVGLVAAAIGAVWYLRRTQDGGGKGSKKKGGSATGGRSAFKFPDGKTVPGRNAGKIAAPKGKKAKAKAKKAAKAEKAAKSAASGGKNQQQAQQNKKPGGGGDGQQASTSVINYTYFDSARRDTLIPIQKRKTLTAKDIMDKDAEARQQAQQQQKK